MANPYNFTFRNLHKIKITVQFTQKQGLQFRRNKQNRRVFITIKLWQNTINRKIFLKIFYTINTIMYSYGQ